VREFGTADTPIDGRSGVVTHMKAMVVAAAASPNGKVDEQSYWRALSAVGGEDGTAARRDADDDVIASHCRAAEALADLAAERLRQAGLKRSDPTFADRYVSEVEQVSKQFQLPCYQRGA
jgi:hypothetical protein